MRLKQVLLLLLGHWWLRCCNGVKLNAVWNAVGVGVNVSVEQAKFVSRHCVSEMLTISVVGAPNLLSHKIETREHFAVKLTNVTEKTEALSFMRYFQLSKTTSNNDFGHGHKR